MASPKEFGYCLSAFLTAVRAPFQYVIGEIKKPPRNMALSNWYDARVNASPVLQFFRDERNFEIHEEPRRPKAQVSGQIPIQSGGAYGLPDTTTGEMPKMAVYNGSPVLITAAHNIEWSYTFVSPTGAGDQDVLRLCETCIMEVEAAIDEGVANGLIII